MQRGFGNHYIVLLMSEFALIYISDFKNKGFAVYTVFVPGTVHTRFRNIEPLYAAKYTLFNQKILERAIATTQAESARLLELREVVTQVMNKRHLAGVEVLFIHACKYGRVITPIDVARAFAIYSLLPFGPVFRRFPGVITHSEQFANQSQH